jgi:class 3 adenylate cyclase/pimeloyl-ACP methyl ester carboxylesterase
MPYFVGAFTLERSLVPAQDQFFRRLGDGRRIVRYDGRGTGLSQRDVDGISFETLVQDLAAVVKAACLERFSLFGAHTGGPPTIAYAVAHPGQIEQLILYGTYHRGADVVTREGAEALAMLCRSDWRIAAQTLADPSGQQEFAQPQVGVARMLRESSTGEMAARLIAAVYESDVTDLLPRVRARTLVVHRRADPVWPFAGAQILAARIPHSEFAPLEGNGGLPGFGDHEAVSEAIEDFLSRSRARVTEDSALDMRDAHVKTIVFTDLVGHTAMMQRLGDGKGRDVLREHERITRDLLKRCGGTEIKTDGDGFMMSFGSVTAALDCAIAMQRAFAARNADGEEPLHVRIGLNAGEPIDEGGDLFGSSVILASRIAERAGAGEILVPETLRHLLSGKSYVYADRGETLLKGFEDAVRLYEVRWRE